MVKALFDTNILVDYLNGHAAARDELARYDGAAISIVTWMEVMVGAGDDVAAATKAFLDSFAVIELDEAVAARAVRIRRETRMKLPDAIVLASAKAHDMLFVTRNSKDFPGTDPGVRHPYAL